MPDIDAAAGRSRARWTSEGVRWVIVTLLIPFAGFVWNEVQKREVERQKQLEKVRADEQTRVANARDESDIVIKLMPALASSDDALPTRGIALAVLLNLAGRRAMSPELVSSVQIAVDTSQQRLREGKATEAERAALIKIAKVNDRSSDATEPPHGNDTGATPVQSFPVQIPRVYIQIFDEADRDPARELQDWCTNGRRWLTPGIENVVATSIRAGRKPPAGTKLSRVVYFNTEDSGRAEDLANHLRATGTPSVEVQFGKLKAPPGQLEVWFPKRND